MKRITSSQETDQIAQALAVAQGAYKPAVKNAVNPHFKNRYADLSSLIEATREALVANGLSYTQGPMFDQGRMIMVSRLMHKSGQWLENEVSLKLTQDTPQAAGSVITYGRRYGLSTLLGICGEEDDDGNASQGMKGGRSDDKSRDRQPTSGRADAGPGEAGASREENPPAPKPFDKTNVADTKRLMDRITSYGLDPARAFEIFKTCLPVLHGHVLSIKAVDQAIQQAIENEEKDSDEGAQ